MQIDWKGHKGVEDPVYQRCKAVSEAHLEPEEFEVALAEISYDMREDWRYKYEPAPPTVLFNYRQDKKDPEFKKIPGAERAAKVRRLFDREDVKTFLEEKTHIETQNFTNAVVLEEQIAIWFKWGDTDKAAVLHGIYQEYPSVIKKGDRALWKKKTDKFGECERIR